MCVRARQLGQRALYFIMKRVALTLVREPSADAEQVFADCGIGTIPRPVL